MTAVIDLEPVVTDPPDHRVEQPPEPETDHSNKTCAHCSKPATLRFNGHDPDKLRTAGREPCLCPRPHYLCGHCYVGWFRYYNLHWYTEGHATCGYCGATGNTIEELMPFHKIP